MHQTATDFVTHYTLTYKETRQWTLQDFSYRRVIGVRCSSLEPKCMVRGFFIWYQGALLQSKILTPSSIYSIRTLLNIMGFYSVTIFLIVCNYPRTVFLCLRLNFSRVNGLDLVKPVALFMLA